MIHPRDKNSDKQVASAKRQREVDRAALAHFAGPTHGSFDGEIKEVDLRGSIPQMKLVLSAGGAEIDCVSKVLSIERIRESLDRRVWVEGTAIYGGSSALPDRLEITDIKMVAVSENITKWRGAFEPFELTEWEE